MNKLIKLLSLGVLISILAACTNTNKSGNNDDVENAGDDRPETVTIDANDNSVSDSDRNSGACSNAVYYFEFDKSSLTAEARRDLDACAADLRSSPRDIRLEGHGDERGTREYNIALGERRAKAVSDYLVSSGVSRGSIETISYGEENAAVSGDNEAAWSKNRRVELK